MIDRLKQWFNPYPGTVGALRLGFAAAYISLVGALLLYTNYVSVCAGGSLTARWWSMAGLLMLMLFVERFDLTRDEQPVARRFSATLLVVRAVLVQGVVFLDCTGIAVILYPIVPFATFFVLGREFARVVTLAYWLLVAARTWLLDNTTLQTGFDDVTIMVVFSLLLIFMLVIARHIDREERSNRHTRQLLARLEISHRQLQAYAAQVADLAAAEERNRLAREIHDSVGHHLTAINIQLEKAVAFRERNPTEADQAIRDAKMSAAEALADVRQSVSALRRTDEVFLLKRALADLATRMETTGLNIDLRMEGDENGYTRPVLTALFRVIQEGLTNVQKHASATSVFLNLDFGPEEAHLTLRDDGTGFDTDTLLALASSPDRSFGLQGLQERLELVRGQISVASDPLRGTELTVTVPRDPKRLKATGAA